MSTDLLVGHVKDALANFYDPIRLQNHALHDLLDVPSLHGASAGEALRRSLFEAIESLKPPPGTPTDHPSLLNYRLLWAHYIEGLSPDAAARQLGISGRTFYRRQQETIQAVAGVLWSRHARAAESHAFTPAGQACSDDDHAVQEAVRFAMRAARRLLNLAQVLADAQDTLAPLAALAATELCMSIPAQLPPVLGDPAVFHQILVGLLSEVLRAVHGGVVHVHLRGEREQLLCRLWVERPERVLASDVGAGRTFLVSRSMLGVYGGRVWLEKERAHLPGIGFSVPLAESKRVLLIDDDADTTALFRRYLHAESYIVDVANSSREVEEQLATHVPDVIVLDVMMPQEDGWQLLRRLKGAPQTATVPIVVCSVLHQPHLAVSLGATDALIKPVSRDALLKSLHRALAGAKDPRPAPPGGR
jgi:CheY-like chemotaxis protein